MIFMKNMSSIITLNSNLLNVYKTHLFDFLSVFREFKTLSDFFNHWNKIFQPISSLVSNFYCFLWLLFTLYKVLHSTSSYSSIVFSEDKLNLIPCHSIYEVFFQRQNTYSIRRNCPQLINDCRIGCCILYKYFLNAEKLKIIYSFIYNIKYYSYLNLTTDPNMIIESSILIFQGWKLNNQSGKFLPNFKPFFSD